MAKTDIKKFKKLVKERTTLKIFHRNYIIPNNPEITYTYFSMQLNGHTPMSDIVRKAIQKYIDDVS